MPNQTLSVLPEPAFSKTRLSERPPLTMRVNDEPLSQREGRGDGTNVGVHVSTFHLPQGYQWLMTSAVAGRPDHGRAAHLAERIDSLSAQTRQPASLSSRR